MQILERFIGHAGTRFEKLPDKRRGKNCHYSMRDIGMSALSVFFMHSASWLSYQRELENIHSTSNIKTLFKVNSIPTDNHIRNMLDGIDPYFFRPIFDQIIDDLINDGALNRFSVFNNKMLISVDGTEFFNSKHINCQNCNVKYHKKLDEREYFHTMVGLSICSPNTTDIIPLQPLYPNNENFNKNLSDIKSKQDNEYKCFKRLLENRLLDRLNYDYIFLLDALYATKPVIDLIKNYNKSNFIITCKPGSNKNIFEFVNNCELNKVTKIKKVNSHTKEKIEYEYINNIPLLDSDDTTTVNFISAKITPLHNAKKLAKLEKKAKANSKNKTADDLIKIKYFSFITDIEVNDNNIEELINCGRTRWRLENGFNSLKKRGYNFEHNFGHGKQTLANVLATLMVLAFLIHSASKITSDLYKKAREKYSSHACLILHIRVLTSHMIFSSFTELFIYIVNEQNIGIRAP